MLAFGGNRLGFDVLVALNIRAPWVHRRDRLLSSPAFQRWASRSVFLRWIVKRQSRQLFDLVAGFAYSQALLALVQTGLIAALAKAPLGVGEAAAVAGLTPERAELLLKAGVSIGILEWRSSQQVGLSMLGVVLASSPAILSMVHHHADFYQDLSDPVALLRDPDPQTRMRRYWAYASDGQARPGGLDAAQVSDYSRLMADSQPLVAQQVLDAYDFRGHRSLLDIGGGLGRFVSAVGHAHPHLELALVDLPAVAEQATAAMANDAKLRGRVVCHGADFFRDPLPSGADLVSLVRVLYDHPDDRVLALLRRARGCFGAAGGRILIAEPMAGTVGAQAMGDGYFGFYLLAMGGGRARSAAELIELLGEAGFVRGRALQTDLPLQTGLVVAEAAALQ